MKPHEHPVAPLGAGQSHEDARRSKPRGYLVATDHRMIPPPAQRDMSARAGSTVVEVTGSNAILCPSRKPQRNSSRRLLPKCARPCARGAGTQPPPEGGRRGPQGDMFFVTRTSRRALGWVRLMRRCAATRATPRSVFRTRGAAHPWGDALYLEVFSWQDHCRRAPIMEDANKPPTG